MFPFGYWTSSATQSDIGTLESSSRYSRESEFNSKKDPYPVAPSHGCLQACALYLATRENQKMLQNQLDVLVDKVISNPSSKHPLRGKGIPESAVVLLFSFSRKLKLSDNVKYLACEIFDSFMIKFNCDMLNVFRTMCLDSSYHTEVEKRIRSNGILRIGSCLQLASKTYSYGSRHESVGTATIQDALHEFDCHMSFEVIRKSELRVLQVMDYNLNFVTPLDVIELALVQLGFNQTEFRRIYSLTINVLDFLYLKQKEISDEFFHITVAENPMNPIERKEFAFHAEHNSFIEGCAVIITVLFIYHMEDHPAIEVLKGIASKRTNLRLVINLSMAIVHCFQKKKVINSSKEAPACHFKYFLSPATT